MLLLGVIGVAGLSALGIWQLERRVWKLALIEQVDQRVHAAPVAAPAPADWPAVTAADEAYLRVRAAGIFLNDRETLVHATTELGSGYWVLTPFRTDRGFTVLVNRGFVSPDQRAPASRRRGEIDGPTQVTGLLRLSEPKGGFLRKNDPEHDLWYSRDVAAIGAARGLADLAPYFIDADAVGVGVWPRGGLTVINFPNNHLVYAITWFSMALLLAIGIGVAIRAERRRPQ
jgi:surfeit locus 1 family protein